ncbi:hypothetical protein WH95_01945 [Kiloniella litopenaei]|uniref:Uncharacterized protein n=1 Tax=Kiloniella litopenaei TaxID=1549748 RepID=A0A0M2REY8_9PROT|nr:hypothetical protein [Kiloniella litopenaei]KKJ78138.1 hypothetical protein WH95_01945 [Kiloniella litopenaei]
MAHVSVNVAQPVSFAKEGIVAFVKTAVSDAIIAYKAKRRERRIAKILNDLDPRLVRDIIPQ